ncbi:MAG: FtsX-like permease family protein [Acidobacteriaceae bacterium]|nr:FtsX-like permease family protein [Acidobacteriaceae bacterium]
MSLVQDMSFALRTFAKAPLFVAVAVLRTREIGIRMAIGAAKTDVLWRVMREVLILLGIGMAIAFPAAWILTQSVRSQLYGIDPVDPMSIATASLAIGCVALFAGYLPTRRATRIDPMCALRYK